MADTAIDPNLLLSRFGLSEFRRGQRDVVDSLAAGHDVMCVMPTGGGKSLCYQLPSLARDGTTIVVSPLIALMKDQVDALQTLGINAKLINSSLTASQQSEVMQEVSAGTLDLVYVAPERLRNGRFLDAVASANVSLLAVDEAHCVSEWGHDFRPDYARLGHFRERYLRGVQTIALTATATPTVRQDIADLLGLKEPKVFVTGFARTNLRFSVGQAKTDREKDQQLADYLSQEDGAGIIYAATRKRCEELADWLPEKIRRPVGVYHAGLEPAQRHDVQERFMKGDLSAIVATNAFGMGIDKSDIRYVVHYNMPGSLEAYYQEAGRAGRDGLDSECRLLFSYSDRYVQEFFIDNRYPSKETIRKVYEFLLSRPEDPIELTLDQVRQAIDLKEGSESIGTAETLLARAGVLKRLDSNSNQAIIRIDDAAPTMLDYLPREAKLRRRVMSAIEKVIGRRRGEDVYVQPTRLMEMAEVDREQLTRTLRELRRLKTFDYVPPFRGRAVHVTQRDVPFEKLDIDFAELDRRKAAEYQKLESVIGFARTSGCRQRIILDYFGDPNAVNCGSCDRCQPDTPSRPSKASKLKAVGPMQTVDQASLLRGIRVTLSGVTRMHGRFGKNLVAQMLCGSKSKKLQQWKLHRLSTYGMLAPMKQSEVATVIDALVESGLVAQREVDQRRPTVEITDAGKRVMKEIDPLPDSVQLVYPIAKRLATVASSIESGDVQSHTTAVAGNDDDESYEGDSSAPDAGSGESTIREEIEQELADRLKRWRRKTSAALGYPAFRVLTNATIDRIVEALPQNAEQLEMIAGVGQATMEQFGYDIVELVQTVVRSHAEAESTANDPDDDPQQASKIPGESGSADVSVPVDSRSMGRQNAAPPASGSPGAVDTPDHREPPLGEDSREGRDVQQREDVPQRNGDNHGECDRSDAENAHPAANPTGPAANRMGAAEDQCGDATDAYWTWRLFRDGYSASQVAQIRRCDVTRLDRDLAVAAAAGHEVRSDWWSDPSVSHPVVKPVQSSQS
tara:strand:+ start:37101 stop:40160 length:3060 start_codon:yes stop_codon:yes gene_type:complete